MFAAVQPALVELSSPLARVEGSQNLVMATGKYGGETVFGGHGAGGHPTAVAVVSDILAIARAKQTGMSYAIQPDEKTPTVTADFTTRHYLRFLVKDRPGIIASLATILSQCGINIDAVVQKPGCPKSHLPFLITLEECKASLVDQALRQINSPGFPGAALFASADFVGGTLSDSAAPYRLWDNLVRLALRCAPLCAIGTIKARIEHEMGDPDCHSRSVAAGRSPLNVRCRRIREHVRKECQSTETPVRALSVH